MNVLFIAITSVIFAAFQTTFRISFFGITLGLDMFFLLTAFCGMTLPLVQGLISVVIIALLNETLGHVPIGYFVTVHLVVFLAVKLTTEGLFAESYLIKSLCVFTYAIIHQIFTTIVMGYFSTLSSTFSFWVFCILQSLIHALFSFPLFILMDIVFEKWDGFFHRRTSAVTGADLFQIKNKQRKFIS